jgi:hypothetical protein
MRLKSASVASLLAIAAILVGGCGGDSDSSSSSSTTADTTTASTSPDTHADPASVETKPGGAKPTPGFKNAELAEYGKEAVPAEREAASKVLTENLVARETKDWAGQCASLTPTIVKGVEEEGPAIAGGSCPERLEEESLGAPAIIFKNTLTGPIAALRVEGNSGYALYHGNDGKDWAMPMKKESDGWKVDSLTSFPLS